MPAETQESIETRRKWAIDRAITVYTSHGQGVQDHFLMKTADMIEVYVRTGGLPPAPTP